MGYVGNQQTEGFSQVPAKQDLTGATGTSLTLTHAVASAEGIDLFINNVRQESGEAYSIAGDGVTVTLTGSVVASDDIYVVYNSLALQTTVPPDASVSTAKIIDGSVTSAKLDTNIAITGNLSVTGTSPGKLTGIQTFTSSGTYTPTSGTTKVLVYVVGGGGAGGGVDGQGGGTAGAGGGGGGGGCAVTFVTSLGATETVTIGAGGTGVSGANTGGGGGTSSFGSHAVASGGSGGSGRTASAPSNVGYTLGGAAGGGSTGDLQFTGTCGGNGAAGGASTSEAASGVGGSSFFGGGDRGRSGDSSGLSGRNYGGGGSGAVVTGINTNYAGGNGRSGIVVIYEYQ